MKQEKKKSGTRKGICRWLMITGMVLTAVWLCSLAGASFVSQQNLESTSNPYNHWTIWVGAIGICFFMCVASVCCIRFNRINLGGWISHLGVLLLFAGGVYFATAAQSGYCLTQYKNGKWDVIETFFDSSQKEHRLPQSIRIEKSRRILYPASNVTKDYIWELVVGDKKQTLSFNNPVDIDKYRITQGQLNAGEQAGGIFAFKVNTRPGINIIWTGLTLICLGLIYAFYVKPIFIKRKTVTNSLIIFLLAGFVFVGGCKKTQAPVFDKETQQFLSEIDGKKLNKIAIQYEGRICPLDTLSRSMLSTMTTRDTSGFSPAVSYLEFYFNSGEYIGQQILTVKSPRLRSFIHDYLGDEQAKFRQTGCIAPASIVNYKALEELSKSGRVTLDELKRARRNRIQLHKWDGLTKRRGMMDMQKLSLAYSAFIGVGALRILPDDNSWLDAHELLKSKQDRGGVIKLATAWRNRDAQKVNTQLDQLIKSQNISGSNVRKLELFYNRLPRDILVLAAFAIASLLLLFGLCGMKTANKAGMIVFVLATIISGLLFIARWILSQRGWFFPPLASQYEALTGSILLAGIASLIVEKFRDGKIFATVCSFYAVFIMVTLLFMQRFAPGSASSELGAVSGILSSRIMSLHVAVIVIGHAFVGMTMLLSMAYLAWVLFKGPASLESLKDPENQSLGQVLDRANIILVQLGCLCVIAGTALGAYWADFAWSRWWGWDPKETWALITALSYVIIFHLRFVSSSKWRTVITAVGCIIGGSAMLFNWFAVNYIFVGLHSYN